MKIKLQFVKTFILVLALVISNYAQAQYCPSIPVFTADEEIMSVTFNGISTPAAYAGINGCSTPAPGATSSLGRYSDFTPLGSMWNFNLGATVPFTIVEDECDGPLYWTNGIAVWIDFNQNGFFTDPGEQVYVESALVSSPRTVTGSFVVPSGAAIGQTRMRIICAESTVGAALTPCLAYNYGETEDWTVTIGNPGSGSNLFAFPIPNFYAPDTVWLNSPATLINTSVNHTRVYWNLPQEANLQNGYFRTCFTNPNSIPSANLPNQCNIDTANNFDNFTYTFNRPGRWLVRLTAINGAKRDSLRDSVEKWIYVDTPSRKPQASFIAFKKIVGLSDYTSLYDLSSYGPTNWYWWYNPACNMCNQTLLGYGYNIIYPDYDSKPIFVGRDPGVYDICMQAGNIRGIDTICIKDYLAVVNSYNLCNANFATQRDTAGLIFGINGPNQSYDRTQITGACQGVLISPCADSLFIYVEKMKMYPGDSIDVYNGTSASAPKLASLGGASLSDVPVARRFLRAGRQVFVRYRVQTGANPSIDSAGFSLRWAIKPASYGKPIAKFNLPDTLYSLAPLVYENKSSGALMQYSWDTDGNGTFGDPAQSPIVDSISAQPTRTFLITTASLRKICLAVYNCVGSDTVCKNVMFLPIQSAPIARIAVSKRAGFTTDTYQLFDKSLNGPKQWRWYVTLGGLPGTAKVTWVTSNASQNPTVIFGQAKKYTIHLWVMNDRGTDSTMYVDYIDVGSYDQPNVLNSGDATNGIGISRVTLVGGGIDTIFSNAYTPKSQYITGFTYQVGRLFKGVNYSVNVQRPNNNAPADFKAWIDFDRNGSFDAVEQVLSSSNNMNVIASGANFSLRPDQVLGTMRMRVGVGLSNATPTLNTSAAYMGTFRDFDIVFDIDTVKPTIALKDLSRIETEINQTYVDPGVTAIDNLEGDISSRYEMIGNVNIAKTGPNYLGYIVRDLYGNVSDTIKRTVFVVLNQRGPKLTLNGGNIRILVNTKFNEPGYNALDNLGNNINMLVQTSTDLDTSRVGSYNIIYNITDADGFSVIRTRTVTVIDSLAPTIVAKNNPYVQQVNTVFDAMNKNVVSITDNYQKPLRNSDINVLGEVNPNNIGTYNLVYTASDSFNNDAKPYLLEVQVKDLIAPTIELRGDNPTNVEVCDGFTDPGYTLTDNYWPINALTVKTKSNLVSGKIGTGTIEYTLTDGSGNTAVVTRSVNFVKKSKPTLTLTGPAIVEIDRFSKYNDQLPLAQDCYYTNLTPVADLSKLNNQIPGTYLVSYYVTDPSGNSAVPISRQVKVRDNFISAVEEVKTGDVKLYPVPTNGLMTIELNEKENIKTLKVFDMLGKEIADVKVNVNGSKAEIDLQGKAFGIYILNIETETATYTKKFNLAK